VGDRVADIVHGCSDSIVNMAAGQQKEEWRKRKMRYIEHLKTVDRETCLVSLSDKVQNVGKRPKEDTLWYYRELAKAFQGLFPSQLAEELMEIVIVLENE
jgi:(p)ppGpp synthase/HD superfamily hydrolase